MSSLLNGTFEETINLYGLRPVEVLAGKRLETLLTSMFLHGGILHIFGNMLYLYIFGDNVGDALGWGKFLLFYLGTGLISALAQAMTDPGSSVPTIGASGAISAVLGAYVVLYPRARALFLFYASSGRRRSEILDLRLEDVDFERRGG